MKNKMLLVYSIACLLLLSAAAVHADDMLEALTPDQEIAAFRTDYVYDNEAGKAIGARFRHIPSGMIFDVLRIQSVPQAYMWINTPAPSDKGEPHTCEHLLLGKGNKGRYVASLEEMSLGSSSASTYRTFTNYHFHTTAGGDVFYDLFEAKLDALLHPNFTDEEIRREVRNMGIVANPTDSSLSLEEKGTVYTEMVSGFERAGTRIWREMQLMMFGKGHPLSNSSGGTPEALRELTPEDLWKFHKETHNLSNMGIIASIPSEYELNGFLKRISDILARVEPDSEPGFDPGTLDDRLPPPNPAQMGSSKFVEFPHQNENEPSYLIFAWPPTLELDFYETLVLDLFLENLASGQTSNLYKRFVDSQKRSIDIGASEVWGGRESDRGNPIYIGFSDVRQDALKNDTTVDSVRTIVLDEIRKIAAFEDGSDELTAFNERIRNKIIERRRGIRTFLSRPPRFGYRGTGDSWRDFLKGIQNVSGFERDLTLKERFDYVENMLEPNSNFWRSRIQQWGLLGFDPYTLAAVPNPDLLEQELEAKNERIAGFIEETKSKYGLGSDEEAISHYKDEYDAKTDVIDEKAKEIEMPAFVENPPMTLDDQLDYNVEELPGGGPMVVSTFETVTGATVGMAFDMHVIPEALLVYVAALPTMIDDVGVIKDGTPISYDEMREKIRQEILWVFADVDVSYTADRVELTMRASGSSRTEAEKAMEWLQLKLFHPDWRVENLPRIRDAIDLALTNARNTMKGSEERWSYNPAMAYWKQTNPLILMTDCFLTRTHGMQRIRWMLKEASTADVQHEFTQFMNDLADIANELGRPLAEDLLSAISGQSDENIESAVIDIFASKLDALSEEARGLVTDATDDLRQNLSEVPDGTLSTDWEYVCKQIAADFATSPQKALTDLDHLMNLVRRQDNVRSFVISNSSVKEVVLPIVRDVAAKLSSEPSEMQEYSNEPMIESRLAEHVSDPSEPVYVGLINENTQNGIYVNNANCASFKDFDRESLLDFLAARLYGGGGAHSMFMKTWSAGLAYSNGLRSNEFSGRIVYYAERCPDLAQTMQFVVSELKNAPYDPTLADYAVAQAFQASRAGSNYEGRGEAMAANLVDGITPDAVRNFREAVLELSTKPGLYDELQTPDLYDELRARMLPVYGRVLPGIDPPGGSVDGSLYFIIGPEKQFQSFEEYLRGTEGETTVHRLHPRDYWIVGGAAN
jgi:Zn-dependent M16 (insulinase) family peptidase